MCNFINIIDSTWENFVQENPIDNIEIKKYIYRGQTNGSDNGKFTEWEIVSSFNRYYKKNQYRFSQFIGQQVSFIESTYAGYEFVKNSEIANSNMISKIYFLQHYGIPTCFIDFTFNPLISLYFSISALKGQSGGTFTVDGFPLYYPEDHYFTIIKINIEELKKVINIKNLEHHELDLFINYDSYSIEINNFNTAHISLDLSPLDSIDYKNNFNLQRQSACFLLYDNASKNSYSFEKFLDIYLKNNKIDIKVPIITKYHIKYNSAYKPMHSRQPNYESLFQFLINKNITGKTLFNDIQGLKYDFNFFHQI